MSLCNNIRKYNKYGWVRGENRIHYIWYQSQGLDFKAKTKDKKKVIVSCVALVFVLNIICISEHYPLDKCWNPASMYMEKKINYETAKHKWHHSLIICFYGKHESSSGQVQNTFRPCILTDTM